MKRNRGSVLFEALVLFELLGVLLFVFHLKVLRDWRVKLETLQKERLIYDGVIHYKGNE